MASDVKECYCWGVAGCGWLGQAFARHIAHRGETIWGTGRKPETLEKIRVSGALPLKWDLSIEGPHPQWPSCRFLLVALPPSALQHDHVRTAIQFAMNQAHWTVLISSTSVYPESSGLFVEDDAIHRISPHSGVSVKSVEEAFGTENMSILRAGGLIGPGRPLFRTTNPRPSVDPSRGLNIIHQEDVIAAILHLSKFKLKGPYNLTCPVIRCRADIKGTNATAQSLPPSQSKRVSSQKLLDTGFSFHYPDPLVMPNLYPSTD